MSDRIAYVVYDSPDDMKEILPVCNKLFNGHYGKWAKSGKPITLSEEKFTETVAWDRNCCKLATATLVSADGNRRALIGQAFAYFDGATTWITQLVVHDLYRRQGIATKLIRMLIKQSTQLLTIVSANPLALRAARSATGVEMLPKLDRRLLPPNESYVKGKLVDFATLTIDTGFPVDRSEVEKFDKECSLSELKPGREYIGSFLMWQRQDEKRLAL
jgi:GNAT superfamily N-acetyltransferase